MIIKIKAAVVCDSCSAEVECTLPMELGTPTWGYSFKHPEYTQGLDITEHFGHGPEKKYLCDKCAEIRGYKRGPDGRFSENMY
jgi:hypothetical protein